jgi:hypothetical protein
MPHRFNIWASDARRPSRFRVRCLPTPDIIDRLPPLEEAPKLSAILIPASADANGRGKKGKK